MGRITKIPDNIMMEIPLSDEQKTIFIEQINRFNELSKVSMNNDGFSLTTMGKLCFKKGTIIHGTNVFDYDKIDGIANSGILTGQAIGISEDCETYYCADFHRVKEDISVDEYNSHFAYNDGRCPFGKRADISKSIAFVIVPNDDNKELLSYDCYRDTTFGIATRSFVNSMPLVSDKDVASSILYGVPANCISGIVVGGKIVNDKEKIDYLISKFPNCYIVTCFGELIYNPRKNEVSMEEFVELKREKAMNDSYRRLNEKLLHQQEMEIDRLRMEQEKIMNAMFTTLDNEQIRNVLISMGWQSVSDEYIEDRKGVRR